MLGVGLQSANDLLMWVADVRRVVVVLGGNAFAKPKQPLTMAGQFQFARDALTSLRPILESDANVLLTHGNGPQVGHMLTRVEESLGKAYALPLEVCVAESEGELGYVLEQTLYNLLPAWGRSRPIASLLTQVVVDENDSAFQTPSKPVGPFYSETEADKLRTKGFCVVEDAGRGYRRIVPSPEPLEIVEAEIIVRLLDLGVLVIAAGGGGIPVVRIGNQLHGVEAVVDKDLSSALLGELIDSKLMVMLTGVPCAYRNYGRPDQEPIGRISVDRARSLLAEGHFAPGSMKPKVDAAIRFCRRSGTKAIVCNSESLPGALAGTAGTIVEH